MFANLCDRLRARSIVQSTLGQHAQPGAGCLPSVVTKDIGNPEEKDEIISSPLFLFELFFTRVDREVARFWSSPGTAAITEISEMFQTRNKVSESASQTIEIRQ